MLKGLRGILEKGLQIAAPLIGNTILPGGLGAAAGSGIASLITGNKPRDALLAAGLSGFGASRFGFGKAPVETGSSQAMGADIRAGREMLNFNRRAPKQNIFSKIGSSLFTTEDGKTKPTALGTSLAVGLPAILAGIGAAQDARKAQPMDPSTYMSAVDRFYGGQFSSPPPQLRIGDLNQRISIPQNNLQTSPALRADGGIMGSMTDEVRFRADDGTPVGLMTMADGGESFPRKTGQISGPGGPKDDKIPAMLSDGEFVFTAKAVDNAGGPKAMYAMMNKLDPESEKPNEAR
tara:strand:+ start:30 stop:905 length:876 start_codon:yes stop_codon:yes gene_type:complete